MLSWTSNRMQSNRKWLNRLHLDYVYFYQNERERKKEKWRIAEKKCRHNLLWMIRFIWFIQSTTTWCTHLYWPRKWHCLYDDQTCNNFFLCKLFLSMFTCSFIRCNQCKLVFSSDSCRQGAATEAYRQYLNWKKKRNI